MIQVEVTKRENKIIRIHATGHAESGEYGHDLVCASASAILTGGASALNEIQSFNVRLDEGNIDIRLKDEKLLSHHDEIVLETVLIQLQTIENSYPKFIKIKIL